MARPRKQGVDYFALDVDFFNDIKIRKIKRSCGPESVAVIICVLCNIYRDKGYYMKWDVDMPFIISEESGATEDQVSDTVSKAIEVGFFNEELAKKNIITSLAIQSRYTRIVKDAKRKGCEISKKYDLLEKDEELPPEETELPPEETPVIPEETGVSEGESTHSIVKDSIVKKSKEEESKEKKLEDRKLKFAYAIKEFNDQYDSVMLRAFYEYWTEPNKSKTKFRQEMEKTWDLERRLKTWASREKFSTKKNDGHDKLVNNVSVGIGLIK